MQTCCAVAEGGAYGEPQAGGNSFAYWFLATALAGAAGFVSIAPHTVSTPLLQQPEPLHCYDAVNAV